MTELENKIWDTVHKWCGEQYHEIPDQNRRYLMDKIKELVLSNVSNSVCDKHDFEFKRLGTIGAKVMKCKKCGFIAN